MGMLEDDITEHARMRKRDQKISKLEAEVERLQASLKMTNGGERELSAFLKQEAEVKRLKAGLQMLAKQEYDAGYTPEDFAKAILSGDEP